MKSAILVPVDNTPISKEVLRVADEWAGRMEARLVVLHCRSTAIQELIERGELQSFESNHEEQIEVLQISTEWYVKTWS